MHVCVFDVDVNMKQGRFRGTRKGETPVDISSSIPANLRPSSAFAESLDNPFPTTYTKDRKYDDIRHRYNFEMPPEGEQKKVKKGTILFSPTLRRGHYDLEFDVDDQSTPTGAVNTAKLFSTVVSSTDDFMKKYPKTKGIAAVIPSDEEIKTTDVRSQLSNPNLIGPHKGETVPSGRSKLYTRIAKYLGDKHGFDVEVDDDGAGFKGTRKKAPKLAEEVKRDPNRTGSRTGLGSTKLVGVRDPKTGKIKIKHVFANEPLKEEKRIPKTKEGQDPETHSDLYTDEDPKGTIHGLGFTNASRARESVEKIKNSGRKHAHKIQAAIAMSQRAKVASQRAKDPKKKKSLAAAHKVYQSFIDRNKKSD